MKKNIIFDDTIKLATILIKQNQTTADDFLLLMKDWFADGVGKKHRIPIEISWVDDMKIVKVKNMRDCDLLIPFFISRELLVPVHVVIQA